ncbi:MAG TPA: ammonia monooxygenase [Porphyromonadaceae bacterium]|nr:ammonia monooxygenase [Porphyromonadaceae bacterium]HBB00750.1 ammonia monooxygenase [Porphyromonadaceae bacterium]HCC19375.1 ammonia monooxygenase [Porphyromonadaceae bacterium]
MAKFHKTKSNDLVFHCPGCNAIHVIDSRWSFNENVDMPTISPSLLVRWPDHVCHSFIREGKIQFLSDCTHKLKGQTVEIPDFETLHPNWTD